MKKKNLLTVIVSLALVAVLAVGATLAYLTASDSKLINTFTFANGMTVILDETLPAADLVPGQYGNATIEQDDSGIQYTNVVPGQWLPKKPVITGKTSVDAYVFVKVTASDKVQFRVDTEKWRVVTDSTLPAGTNVYYKTVLVANDATNAIYDVSYANGSYALGAIFDGVTIPADVDTAADPSDIVIKVAAVQMSQLDLDTAYAEAAKIADFQ